MGKMIRACPLDSSALVHLASRNRRYTNMFRLSATLTDDVSPVVLQRALERTAPRFPLIAAGIRRGNCQYAVVPSNPPPQVAADRECLACMPAEIIHRCAMRMLYRDRKISVEIFHSLTDGFGGLSFLTALLTEYAALAYGIPGSGGGQNTAAVETLADDYITYAGRKTVSFPHSRVYRIPGGAKSGQAVHTVTGICDLPQALAVAHRHDVSLTAFLTAVMASSIAELQARYSRPAQFAPIQIMVPVDLRKIFQSRSLRNFSLYALPRVEPGQLWMPVGELARLIGRQLKHQISQERLAGMMAASVTLQHSPLVQRIPLAIKEPALRIGHRFLGDGSSCLSLSNLGEAALPEELRPLVARMEFMLSPRKISPYNCGMISYGGRLYITFSRRGGVPELEKIFFQQLTAAGCPAMVEVDARLVDSDTAWA